MEWGVGVPGGEEAGAMGVEEGEGGGERRVIVYYVGEVGHCFVAFVHGGCEAGCEVVHGVYGVDCYLPAGKSGMLVEGSYEDRGADGEETYSGSPSATQSVFSFSSFAMMMTLSPGWPLKLGMFSTVPCLKVFFQEAPM